MAWTKEDQKTYNRAYYIKNREELIAKSAQWKIDNPDKQPPKEYFASATRRWRERNPEKSKESNRKWRTENPEKAKESKRKSNAKNPDQARKTSLAWREANRPHVQARSRRYLNNRLKTDPEFKIAWYTRIRMRNVLKGIRKSASTLALLGCSLEHARAHIESKFWPGMTWSNWAEDGWHLDHIVPLASWDLTDPAQQAKAFHYTNLQPLWGPDNASKGAKLDWQPAALDKS